MIERTLESVRRWLRLWMPEDITLLGIPGRRHWLAHAKHLLCYGRTVYSRDKTYAQARHQRWLQESYILTFKRTWRGKLFIRAQEPPKT